MKNSNERLAEWHKELPTRWNCQYPNRKCLLCNHDEICKPDYAYEFEFEIKANILKDIVNIAIVLVLCGLFVLLALMK